MRNDNSNYNVTVSNIYQRDDPSVPFSSIINGLRPQTKNVRKMSHHRLNHNYNYN